MPVSEEVSETLATTAPVTVELVTLMLLTALALAAPVGVWSTLRRRDNHDRRAGLYATAPLGVPEFVVGASFAALLVVLWHKGMLTNTPWHPFYVGFFDDPIENLKIMVPPALVMGVPLSLVMVRLLRSAIVRVLRENYVRTAQGKGLSDRVVFIRHVTKNVFISLMPAVVGLLGLLFSCAVIIEWLFNLPGLGTELVFAFYSYDLPVVRAVLFVVPGSFIVISLLVDLLHAWLDPRIRYPAPVERTEERELAARAAMAYESRRRA